jgi:RNA polymerase sigma-70 factor (ECF subfamily)
VIPDGDHDDGALAMRAASGDERAFAMLVTRHKARLYHFARRYVGNADDAYDIVQQSFVAAWHALGRYDPERPFPPWLQVILLNKCRDHVRRERVRRMLLISEWRTGAELVPDSAPGAEERWIAEAGLSALDQAVASLPRALKEPLILTAFEGLSQAETGRRLGISTKAVETRVARARGKLLEALRRSANRETQG